VANVILRLDLMPLPDVAIFRDGVSREDGYRELFAIGCGCGPSEIVDVRFGQHNGHDVVFAAWESPYTIPKPEPVLLDAAAIAEIERTERRRKASRG
jgi:hypothetical protein